LRAVTSMSRCVQHGKVLPHALGLRLQVFDFLQLGI
jgi:hypothetical protein